MNMMNYTAEMARRDAEINKERRCEFNKEEDYIKDEIERTLDFIQLTAKKGWYRCAKKMSSLTYHDYLIFKQYLENLGYKVTPPSLDKNGTCNDTFRISWQEETHEW